MTKPVILVGAGGHASVVAAMLKAIGHPVLGCIALEKPKPGLMDGIAYFGNDAALDHHAPQDAEIIIAIGSIHAARLRATLYEKLKSRGFAFASAVHPSAIIGASVTRGEGLQIMTGAIVQTGAKLGANVIINTGAIIEHGCRLGDHVHVASGAVLAGDVAVGAGAHIGAGAVVLQGLRIGAGATVGAAACVTRDVADGATVIGVPAKERQP